MLEADLWTMGRLESKNLSLKLILKLLCANKEEMKIICFSLDQFVSHTLWYAIRSAEGYAMSHGAEAPTTCEFLRAGFKSRF